MKSAYTGLCGRQLSVLQVGEQGESAKTQLAQLAKDLERGQSGTAGVGEGELTANSLQPKTGADEQKEREGGEGEMPFVTVGGWRARWSASGC